MAADHSTLPPEKKCCTCKAVKTASEFYVITQKKKPTRKPRLAHQCKRCSIEASTRRNRRQPEVSRMKTRKSALKIKYGISLDEYAAKRDAQDDRCAICGRHETMINPKSRQVAALAVDHDHKTGKVRDLLCRACNHGIGSFGDNIDLLRNAVAYLERHSDGDFSQLLIGVG